MDIILNYIFIGFVFIFILDCVSSMYRYHEAFKNIPELRWQERVVCVIIWPLTLIVFIYSYLKSFFK